MNQLTNLIIPGFNVLKIPEWTINTFLNKIQHQELYIFSKPMNQLSFVLNYCSYYIEILKQHSEHLKLQSKATVIKLILNKFIQSWNLSKNQTKSRLSSFEMGFFVHLLILYMAYQLLRINWSIEVLEKGFALYCNNSEFFS